MTKDLKEKKLLKYLVITFIIMYLLDSLTTYYALHLGAIETNEFLTHLWNFKGIVIGELLFSYFIFSQLYILSTLKNKGFLYGFLGWYIPSSFFAVLNNIMVIIGILK